MSLIIGVIFFQNTSSTKVNIFFSVYLSVLSASVVFFSRVTKAYSKYIFRSSPVFLPHISFRSISVALYFVRPISPVRETIRKMYLF